MAFSLPSERLQLLIAGYVLGDLDPDEAAEFEQLLLNNPAILDEVAQLQKVLELSYGVPDVPPPASLRAAILHPAAKPHHSSLPPRPLTRSAFAWSRSIGAMVAVLILALALSNYRLWRLLQTAQTASSQTHASSLASLTYVLRASQAANPATATVVVNPNTLEATLTTEKLPPLPPGQVYALWTVIDKNAPFTADPKGAILTGVFQVNEQGKVVQQVAVPAVYRSPAQVEKLAVTIEDARSPQNHQGTPVLFATR